MYPLVRAGVSIDESEHVQHPLEGVGVSIGGVANWWEWVWPIGENTSRQHTQNKVGVATIWPL